MLMPINLENYFQLSNMDHFQTTTTIINDNGDHQHNDQTMSESFLNLIQIESTESLIQDHHDDDNHVIDTFINGQMIKFIQFNNEKILTDHQQHQQQTSSLNGVIQSETSAPLSSSSSFNNHYVFEIIFKHLVKYTNDNHHDDDDSFTVHHQCVHWDESLK